MGKCCFCSDQSYSLNRNLYKWSKSEDQIRILQFADMDEWKSTLKSGISETVLKRELTNY